MVTWLILGLVVCVLAVVGLALLLRRDMSVGIGVDALTGERLTRGAKAIPLTVPDGEDRRVTKLVLVNRKTAALFDEHGLVPFRRRLRDRYKHALCVVRDPQAGRNGFEEAWSLYDFLYEGKSEHFEQLFEDWVHVFYEVPRDVIRADVAAELNPEPQSEPEPEVVVGTVTEPEAVPAAPAAAEFAEPAFTMEEPVPELSHEERLEAERAATLSKLESDLGSADE